MNNHTRFNGNNYFYSGDDFYHLTGVWMGTFVRLTWNEIYPQLNERTEVWVSINGGIYQLAANVVGALTYDYYCAPPNDIRIKIKSINLAGCPDDFSEEYKVIFQRNFYVSNAGNDANTGLTVDDPWLTLNKVWNYGIVTGYKPGDIINFRRGDTWEEQLLSTNSGIDGFPITYSSYGVGALPIITGKDDITGWNVPANWTQVGGTDVWFMTLNHSTTRPRIWLNGAEEQSAANALGVNAANPHFHDQAATRLYVFATAPDTPATFYARIETANLRTTAMDINRHNYINVNNIDFQGGRYSVRVQESSGIIFENCNIGFNACRHGFYVIYAGAGPHVLSMNGILRNCIVDSGYRFDDDWVFGDPYFCMDGVHINQADNWKIYGNVITDWNHTGFSFESYVAGYYLNNMDVYNNIVSCPSCNYGHGIIVDADQGLCSNNKIHHNLFFDHPVQNQLNGYGLEFYYNIIDTVRGATGYAGQGIGIDLAGYEGNPSYQKIYNNVIANCADYGIRFYDWVGSTYHLKTGIEIYNNILFNNDAGTNYQMYITAHASILNNFFKNNSFYKLGIADVIYYGAHVANEPRTVAEFNGEHLDYGDVMLNNIGGDPLFIGVADFRLQQTSPCIGTGIWVNILKDTNNIPVNNPPEIGAYSNIF